MKKNLKIYNITYGTDSWYRFRSTGLLKSDSEKYNCPIYPGGIGGSEVGTFLGHNEKYDSPIWLYNIKIGAYEEIREDNRYMFFGRQMERLTAEIWQYYDGSEDGYIENMTMDKKIRRCRNVNGYVVNPKYPWLFGSVDRLINKGGGVNLITGELLKKEGILECKNMSIYAYKAWEDGCPQANIDQIHLYMLILELDYAEIAILVGGNNLIVIPIQRDEELIANIIEESHDWWYKRILPAREAFNKKKEYEIKGDHVGIEEMEAITHALEPEPNSSDAYRDWQKKQYEKEVDKMEGSMENYDMGKKDMMLLKLGNEIEKRRSLVQNQVIKELVENNVGRFHFDSMGYMGLSEKKSWLNKIKEKPTDEEVKAIIDNIDLNY